MKRSTWWSTGPTSEVLCGACVLAEPPPAALPGLPPDALVWPEDGWTELEALSVEFAQRHGLLVCSRCGLREAIVTLRARDVADLEAELPGLPEGGAAWRLVTGVLRERR